VNGASIQVVPVQSIHRIHCITTIAKFKKGNSLRLLGVMIQWYVDISNIAVSRKQTSKIIRRHTERQVAHKKGYSVVATFATTTTISSVTAATFIAAIIGTAFITTIITAIITAIVTAVVMITTTISAAVSAILATIIPTTGATATFTVITFSISHSVLF
jgi:hypothetical protein